jgi:uncharacterized protein YqeY
MSLKLDLENALKDAMRASDDVRKRTLRMALSNIRLAELDRGPLDDSAVTAMLQKEVKSRHESMEDARRAGRPDIESDAQAEIDVLQGFLPQPLSDEQLDELVRQVIAEVGAASIKDMGKVMKALTPHVLGRASGDAVAQAVRRRLP